MVVRPPVCVPALPGAASCKRGLRYCTSAPSVNLGYVSTHDVEAVLRQLAERRAENLRERSAIAAETAAAVKAAKDAGIPITRIAKLAGLSRQRVHRMLHDE